MPDCSSMSITSLIRRINAAPDFGYDDEAVELNRKLAAQGKTWRWSEDMFNPVILIIDLPTEGTP